MTASYGPAPTAEATRDRAPGHPCDELCIAAHGAPSDCTCICGGRNHGAGRATHGPDTAVRADQHAFRLAQAFAQADDDAAW